MTHTFTEAEWETIKAEWTRPGAVIRMPEQPEPIMAMAHPHSNCPQCKLEAEPDMTEFVLACQKIYRGSWVELYEKLALRGIRIYVETPEKQEAPKT